MAHIADFERHNGRVPNLRELANSLGLKSSELRNLIGKTSLDEKTEGTSAFSVSLREILIRGQVYENGTRPGNFAAKFLQRRQVGETKKAKELKMHYAINSDDYEAKLASVKKFLEDGAEVNLKVVFKADEAEHFKLGLGLLARFAYDLDDLAIWKDDPRMVGKTATIRFYPMSKT